MHILKKGDIIVAQKVPEIVVITMLRIIGNPVRVRNDPVAVYVECFLMPWAVTVNMGRQENMKMHKSEDLPFVEIRLRWTVTYLDRFFVVP